MKMPVVRRVASQGRGRHFRPQVVLNSTLFWRGSQALPGVLPWAWAALPRVHLVRYGGCLAPHSSLRGAITPTPRQQGVDGHEANTGTPRWSWARLLGRVFDLDMATCPFCRRGSLRIIAAMTQESVITRILRHLKLASVPPPIAPARFRQATFDWVASAHDVARGLRSNVRPVEVCLTPLSVCNPV